MTTDRPLVRMLHQACAFNALTACIVILEESVEDTDYVQDIIDMLQERADDVQNDIESMLDQLSGAVQ